MRIRRSQLLGTVVLCPHCCQKLRITHVSCDRYGINPAGQYKRYWIVTLADGNQARMWEEDYDEPSHN